MGATRQLIDESKHQSYMKNYLVTGGAGFIGSHIVNFLVNSGEKVTVVDINFLKKSFFSSRGLDKKTDVIVCDIRNAREVDRLIENGKFDFIFHLAAQPIVETAYDNPLETFNTNIMGTANVLEAARHSRTIGGILVTSSDKAYGKIPRASENDPLVGNHPYEVSKSAADLIAITYFKTYGLPVMVTRFGNVYGEGDIHFDRIVPGIMESLVTNRQLILRSDGKYVRDYVYVGDVVDAMIKICNNLNKSAGEAFNISSNENLSVTGLIDKIEKIIGFKTQFKIMNVSKNEIPRQSVDFSKIKKNLGWKPKHTLNTTIPKIFEWYKDYFKSTQK